MSAAERYFLKKAKEIPKDVAPGFLLQVYERGEKVIDISWGSTWRYYDLASVTKIIFTVPWFMKLVSDGKLRVNTPITSVLPWYRRSGTVSSLLTHTAGNEWWLPLYKSLDKNENFEFRKNQLREILRREETRKKSSVAVYSDIDFFLLGFILESVTEKNWSPLWHELAAEIGTDEVLFHLGNHPPLQKSMYAPTEDCPWRKKIVQGEVHDENAWMLSGVAPHAGLFATVDGVAKWGLWLRHLAQTGSPSWAKSDVVRTFLKRSVPAKKGDWSLGFMMPTRGSASCGDRFSPRSVGHTGFTGTSFWWDPERDVMAVLLSNRIHPNREHMEFRKWRPVIHNWIMESLDER